MLLNGFVSVMLQVKNKGGGGHQFIRQWMNIISDHSSESRILRIFRNLTTLKLDYCFWAHVIAQTRRYNRLSERNV